MNNNKTQHVKFTPSRPHQIYPCNVYNAMGHLVNVVSPLEQMNTQWDSLCTTLGVNAMRRLISMELDLSDEVTPRGPQ